jgi:adenosylhomocysteine nucleosidase
MEEVIKLGLVVATLPEARPFIDGMALTEESGGPFWVYKNKRMVLVVCGMGKANASMGTTYLCLEHKPSVICNLGAAGATDATWDLGRVLAVEKVIEYDRPQFKTKKPYTHKPRLFRGMETAVLATQDRPVLEPEMRKEISELATLVDMEAAAVVQAARKFKTPCYVFKFVTDTPEHIKNTDIVKNVKEYSGTIYRAFKKKILPHIEELASP